jgi:hypothetical protein
LFAFWGARFATPERAIKGVVTHANDSEEEESQEGPCEAQGRQEGEEEEKIGLR